MKRTHAFLSHDDNNDCDDDDCNPGIADDDYAAVDEDDAHYDGDHHGHLNHKELILSSLAQSQGIIA